MNKEYLRRLTDLYYDITSGYQNIPGCPDVIMTFNSIDGAVLIKLYLHGFIAGANADYFYYIDEDTADSYIEHVIEMFELCVSYKEIAAKYTYPDTRNVEKEISNLNKKMKENS